MGALLYGASTAKRKKTQSDITDDVPPIVGAIALGALASALGVKADRRSPDGEAGMSSQPRPGTS